MKSPALALATSALTAVLLTIGSPRADAQGTAEDFARADSLRERTRDKVRGGRVEPGWIDGGRRFWYRAEAADGSRDFLVVDTATGERRPAFNPARLARALAAAATQPVDPAALPFERIAFADDGSIRFEALGKAWRHDPEGGSLETTGPAAERPDPQARPQGRRRDRPGLRRQGSPRGDESPDGRWVAFVKDHNIHLREKATGEEFAVSEGGVEGDAYESGVYWSPDSKAFVAIRTLAGDDRKVYLIESSPSDQLQPKLHSYDYLKPGDKVPASRPHLFHAEPRHEVAIDPALFDNPWSIDRIRWAPDSSRFTFLYNQRGHQVLRLIAVDAGTGEAKALIEEKSPTFLDYAHKTFLHFLDGSDEIVWMSERNGWNHLYLLDAATGAVKASITRGDWLVRDVIRIDEDARQVWFRAGGIRPSQDPYHIHYARANLDGSGLTILTEGDGTHQVEFSPDGATLVDNYSRVDTPPVSELRSAKDGSLIRVLERGDWSALLAAGWYPPERFVAKGRDGSTDIYGVIYRPTGFDSKRTYPVIEAIYAGPQGAFVPKSFAPYHGPQGLAELGFVVVQIDGMGTNWRSKAFHDVCARDLADAGFPDRILWMKAAAAAYPALDLTRVGVYGGSAGGQNALGALLFHGDFYKAAVADCGCHDNRMDKVWWNELWMGWPVGDHYAAQSNVTNAHKLRGKLLLTVGEMDRNVDPASTMQVVDALIKAGKDFELVVFPGGGHGSGSSPYGQRRLRDFFVRHLLGVEPPDRNAGPARQASTRDPAVTRASQPPEPAPAAAASETDREIETEPSPMRGAIERFEADHGSLRRSIPVESSPEGRSRLRAFLENRLSALDRLDFDALNRAGQVDFLLLRNHIAHGLEQLETRAESEAEIADLLPFAARIVALEEARHRLDRLDAPAIGAELAGLAKAVKKASAAVEERLKAKQTDEAKPIPKHLAYRAARAVDRLRRALKEWHEFYDGYDPIFTWWAAEPYRSADSALADHSKLLRETVAGVKPDDDTAIVGEPIGGAALAAELAHAMIPYTPEELVAIAEREFAWCEAEMKKASAEMGFGDDWKAALEKVKTLHVEPGQQPALIRELALEAIRYLDERELVTIPAMARETWRMEMMTPQRQLVNPFFTGGEVISVSFPTSTMTHEQKLMSMRGNNRHFARATVHHEVIPGHHLQAFMIDRHRPYRQAFGTPFWTEGWALYWETILWDKGFARSPEDRVGMLFWRMHRCARIIFSLGFHLGTMTAPECVDFLVDRVGHERDNASAEVRRSFAGNYGPLYQCAYMLGGLQLRALRRELVDTGKMTERAFHDAILREGPIPIEMVRASLNDQKLTRDQTTRWRFDEAARDKPEPEEARP